VSTIVNAASERRKARRAISAQGSRNRATPGLAEGLDAEQAVADADGRKHRSSPEPVAPRDGRDGQEEGRRQKGPARHPPLSPDEPVEVEGVERLVRRHQQRDPVARRGEGIDMADIAAQAAKTHALSRAGLRR
jgi:hypothetical protein